MQFLVPGLIMMPVISNAYSNVVSSFFGSKFQKSVQELLVSPTRNSTIIWGYVAGGVLRGLIIAGLVSIVALFFAPVPIHNVPIIILFVFLTAVLFALMGFSNSVYAKKFDDIMIIPNFVLTPLTYLGGVFYSIALLPDVWQVISKFNPILYMINGFRYGFLGITDINITIALVIILFFIVGFYILQSTSYEERYWIERIIILELIRKLSCSSQQNYPNYKVQLALLRAQNSVHRYLFL